MIFTAHGAGVVFGFLFKGGRWQMRPYTRWTSNYLVHFSHSGNQLPPYFRTSLIFCALYAYRKNCIHIVCMILKTEECIIEDWSLKVCRCLFTRSWYFRLPELGYTNNPRFFPTFAPPPFHFIMNKWFLSIKLEFGSRLQNEA